MKVKTSLSALDILRSLVRDIKQSLVVICDILLTAGQFGAQFVHEISPWCGVVGDWVLDWIHQAPLQDIDYATMIVMS